MYQCYLCVQAIKKKPCLNPQLEPQWVLQWDIRVWGPFLWQSEGTFLLPLQTLCYATSAQIHTKIVNET